MEYRPPARKVVTRAPWRTVRLLNLPGLFPEPLECESSLERDFVYRAALCPSVACLRHQPLRLDLGDSQRYTPDFLVEYRDRSCCFVEVKPLEKVERNATTFDLASEALRGEENATFVVLTEHDIRRDGAHKRAALILRYRKSVVDEAQRQRVIQVLRAAPDLTLDLGTLLRRSEVDHACAMHLIASRQIAASSNHDIHEGAQIVLNQESDSPHAVHIYQWFGAQTWSEIAGTRSSPDRERTSIRGHADTPPSDDENLRCAQADLERSVSGRDGRRHPKAHADNAATGRKQL